MKREIKFRAWDIEHKQMFWWNVLWGNHRQGDGYIGMVPWGEKQTYRIHRDNMTLIDPYDCELMQFTGLKDKNGNEIYEGDIVRHGFHISTGTFVYIGYVIYASDRAMFYITQKGREQFNDCAITHKNITANHRIFEIIGNIYENPELLKQ